MPELPEVETIIQDLKQRILNKKIIKVEVKLKKIIHNNIPSFVSVLINNQFSDIRRRGKLIIFVLEKKNKYLLIHLRMTGQLIYQEDKLLIYGGHGQSKDVAKTLPSKHTHIIFTFQDQSKLYFNDLRQFAVVQLVNQVGLEQELEKFGLEPLQAEFTLAKFEKLLQQHKQKIKAFLLNQKYIAGLGNIYTDEALFLAGILPERQTNSLTKQEIKKLHRAIKKVLQKAVQSRGTSFNDYVDAQGQKGNFLQYLQVYGRQGKQCLRCQKGIIKKIKVAGRGTRYCPSCQK